MDFHELLSSLDDGKQQVKKDFEHRWRYHRTAESILDELCGVIVEKKPISGLNHDYAGELIRLTRLVMADSEFRGHLTAVSERILQIFPNETPPE